MLDDSKLSVLRNKVQTAAQELLAFMTSDRVANIKLRYPYILVYTLPREQKYAGAVWLPDGSGQNKQNKITLEGFVLKTWEGPHKKYIVDRETKEIKTVDEYPTIQVGNIVVFSHYAGVPPSGESKMDFRILPEVEIPGILEPYEVKEKIYDALFSTRHLFVSVQIEELFKKFIVVPKDLPSRTLSGV